MNPEPDEFEHLAPPTVRFLSGSARCSHCQARRARGKTCWYCGVAVPPLRRDDAREAPQGHR